MKDKAKILQVITNYLTKRGFVEGGGNQVLDKRVLILQTISSFIDSSRSNQLLDDNSPLEIAIMIKNFSEKGTSGPICNNNNAI